jgi:TetR/AcrR family transcriptional regulator, repressor for uid operon
VNRAAREERRQQILAGARTCFLRKGFHAASTADISQEAGVSVANLYQYFPSKQDLVLAIAEQDLEADFELGNALRRPGTLFERLEALFSALIEEAERPGAFSLRLEIFAEAARNPEMRVALARMDAQLVRGLARTIQKAQKRGELAPDLDAEVVAALLNRMLDGFYLAAGGGLLDGRALIPHLSRLLRSGLAAPPADR